MNNIELDGSLSGNPKWTKFAEGLNKSMMEEFDLDGVTVILRERTAQERANEEKEILIYFHERQAFEFAMDSADHFPSPWKVADRIEHFLHPLSEESEG
jgi:hypothetical protein